MKTAKKIMVICLIVSFLLMPLAVYSYSADRQSLNSFVRLHIRANSDSESDQTLKLLVRNEVLQITTALLDGCENKDAAKKILSENITLLVEAAEKVVNENGFDYTVSARLDNERFDRRDYDGFYLPEGYYDALIMEIGSGAGHNWWCVLYPCVCLSGTAGDIKTDTQKVPDRYKTSENVSEGDIKFDFWIVKFFRGLF